MAFYKTKGFKRMKNMLFGVGAAVVLIGALGKLLHTSWAGIMLTVGLLTEAFIFAFSGLIPPDDDYYWEKLYPGINEYGGTVAGAKALGGKKSTAKSLDSMLDDAKIDQSMIDRLGDNLRSLGDNVGQLSKVADTTVATEEFTSSAKEAANALSNVKQSYTSAADAMGKLASASEDTGKYHEQVQMVTKNLAALNAVYEIELQDTNTHLKAMNKFYNNLSTAMGHLDGSLEDASRYKEEIGKLAGNLQQLNNVYGNMLTAMRA